MPEQPTSAMSEPRYIYEVEQAIGVRFFPEPYDEWVAHSDPGTLSPEAQFTYANVYVGGLRLLADARRYYDICRDQPFSLTPDQLRETRVFFTEERERLIHHLRLEAQIADIPAGAKTEGRLQQELNMGNLVLADIVEELNSVLITIKSHSSARLGTLYFPEEEAARVREAAQQIPDVEPGEIRVGKLIKKLETTGEEFYRAAFETNVVLLHRRLPAGDYAYAVTAEDAALLTEYINGPEEHIIVPSEYLTLEDYAWLRRVDRSGVRMMMRKHDLPAHFFPHSSAIYLDGATMYYLDRLRTPLGIPAGHVTLKELMEQAESKGYHAGRLDELLRREGVPSKFIRIDRVRVNTYPEVVARAVITKLPRHSLPLKGISPVELAAFHGITVYTMRERLRKLKSRNFTVGKYMTDDSSGKGVGAYYLKEELLAAGIQVPSTPAFPAGERPYGPHGPARAQPKPRSAPAVARRPSTRRRKEEAFTLEAKSSPAVKRAAKPYRPGSTLSVFERSGPSDSQVAQYRTEMSLPPVKVELATSSSSAAQEPQHAIDEPGTWVQAAPMPIDKFISVMEKLSASQIAERLGVEETVVHEALARIDPGSARPEMVTRNGRSVALYGDRLLVAIREQLVGIPLGYISIKLARKLTPDQLAHARRLLKRQGYEAFEGDRYSPGAMEFLSQHIATILATKEISEE